MATHTKKLINSPETCADDSIDGYIKWNPNVVRVGREKIVVRADFEEHKKQGKVCVLSGGGSGHEPIFTGKLFFCLDMMLHFIRFKILLYNFIKEIIFEIFEIITFSI